MEIQTMWRNSKYTKNKGECIKIPNTRKIKENVEKYQIHEK